MERVFPDTNVLYPISVADLTLRLGDIGLHKVLWSEDLLSEVERVLVTGKALTVAQARYFGDCIRRSFPAGEIKRDVYEDLILTRRGPDPDDHLHSAAAVAGGGTVLLTCDSRGFPKGDLAGVRRSTPDRYFIEQLELHPAEVMTVLAEMGSTRRVPRTIDATLAALTRAGLRRFAGLARRLT